MILWFYINFKVTLSIFKKDIFQCQILYSSAIIKYSSLKTSKRKIINKSVLAGATYLECKLELRKILITIIYSKSISVFIKIVTMTL